MSKEQMIHEAAMELMREAGDHRNSTRNDYFQQVLLRSDLEVIRML